MKCIFLVVLTKPKQDETLPNGSWHSQHPILVIIDGPTFLFFSTSETHCTFKIKTQALKECFGSTKAFRDVIIDKNQPQNAQKGMDYYWASQFIDCHH